MFDWLIEPFEILLNTILAPFKILILICTTFFSVLANCVIFLGKCLTWIPLELAGIILSLIAVAVLYKILGRESQS